MATKKRTSTSTLNFRNFQVAAQYAEGDESVDLVYRLAEFLCKVPAFENLLLATFKAATHNAKHGKLAPETEDRPSGRVSLMLHLASSFYAGVAYGQRFGDNLSQPLPRVDRVYARVRRLGHALSSAAAMEDFQEVVRWRIDAKGTREAVREKHGVEWRALENLDASRRRPTGAVAIKSGKSTHRLSLWQIAAMTQSAWNDSGRIQ